MSGAKKHILITGASGLLGRAVKKVFSAKSDHWEVVGTAFSRANKDLIKMDLTQKDDVFNTIRNFKPQVIVHCAAERRPDVVEKQAEATHQLNVEGTSLICEAAVECNAWLIYISTDYVFDGSEPPYQVDAKPNPLNKYGQSKLQGEKIITNSYPEFAVLRVPILYGEVEKIEESAVTILWKIIQNGTPCKISDYERRYPTHTDDVACAILEMAEEKIKGGKDLSGIFHFSGMENMTKYDMVVAMADAFGLGIDNVVADKTQSSGAPRPYNAHLSSDRLQALGFSLKRTPFKEGIKDVLLPYAK